jgi:hypothetical protein
VLEHERAAIEDIGYPSLDDTLQAITRLQSEIVAALEAREWDERYGKLTDLSAFRREILPLIQGVPLSRLQQATGLALRYVSLIRGGERTPHPGHWPAFIEAAASRDPDARRT